MAETPIDTAHYPGLAKLGPLAADIIHRAWVMPPGQSVTALVMRELVGKDDLVASARATNEDEEILELVRQAIVAFTKDPIPTRKVIRTAAATDAQGRLVVDAAGKPTGEEVDVEVDEPDLDKVTWQVIASQPFPEFDGWKRTTRKMLIAFYNQLNGIDLSELGKSLASGRDWSPSTRTTIGGRSQSPVRQKSSSSTAAQKPGSSTGGSTSRATSAG